MFSRFIWLRPIDKKFSKTIAKELQSIYLEHGYLRVIQCDQGPEFKGAVKKLCRRLKIKIICSRPYHPQSQGKVERSHRSLRAKMEYDILKMGKKGVNWRNNIQEYQHILNNDPKRCWAIKLLLRFTLHVNVIQNNRPKKKSTLLPKRVCTNRPIRIGENVAKMLQLYGNKHQMLQNDVVNG